MSATKIFCKFYGWLSCCLLQVQIEHLQQLLEVLRSKNAELSRAQDGWAAAIKLLEMRAPEQIAFLLTDLPIDRLFNDTDTLSKTGSMNGALADEEKLNRTSSTEGVIARPGAPGFCRATARDKIKGSPVGAADLAPMDIDLELTKKERAQCTQAELDQMRRQRNRVHAKRTRVRKKAQIEELQDMVNEVNLPTHQTLKCSYCFCCAGSFFVWVFLR